MDREKEKAKIEEQNKQLQEAIDKAEQENTFNKGLG